MTSTQVKELPLNNRNFVQLATLAPGVSSDLTDEVGVGLTSTVSLSINGARRNAVNWLVDGVSDVDVGSNITLLSTPSLESIEEFKIITNGYQAEWPRSGGGIVNVVTKSGSSRYTGSAYEFLRSDKLNANSFFRNLNPDPAINSTPSPLKYNNFGGTVGGPACRGKMFFFFSEELRRITRAPTALNSNTYDPAWLTDPTNANYVAAGAARSECGEDAGAVSDAERHRPAAIPQHAADDPEHAAGSGARRLRPEPALAAHGSLHARQQLHRGAGRAVPRPRRAQRRDHGDERAGQVAAAVLRSTHGSNRLNELQFQFSSNTISDENMSGDQQPALALGLNMPECIRATTRRNAVRRHHRDVDDRREPAVSHRIPQLHRHRQLHLAARRRTASRSAASSPSSGRTRTRRTRRRAASASVSGGGHTAFYNFLSGNADGRAATRAPTARRRPTSPSTCASTATSSTRRTRGSRAAT